jgi:hypothetical protein
MKTKLIVLASTAAVLFATTALADTYGRGPSKAREGAGTPSGGRTPALVVTQPDKVYPSLRFAGPEGPSLRGRQPNLPAWAQDWDPSPHRD